VYVFTRIGVTWNQQAYVKASNPRACDYFGRVISLSGDGNTLAVGANREASNATGVNGNQADNSAGGAGAVYLY
ncbi:MAG: FG-GAP repeat protein, partial [Gammaproteobacteria bacterium]